MALEWAALATIVAAEALLLLVVTFPGLQRLRKGLISVAKSALQPLMSLVPFALFLLLDIYWKYEHFPKCEGTLCSPLEHEHHAKSMIKTQRNFLLVSAALLLHWLLYRVTHMLIRIEYLYEQLKKLKDSKDLD
ncbi:hypothetical protein O6H91_16G018800 [Diphasiastrum complanatum]|uniref:Uncharacterized protein n=1 Tax=Diphasiastrum complanatum TaxID=34168 RepID=A0ACC2BA85_DIPCM|nr:hypothetical protein O6H91_16G018800 [Diphasiastrum complanatum]